MVFVICGLCVEAGAQEFRVTQLKIAPDGSMDWHSGSTVSKSGVVVKFQSVVDPSGKIVNYRVERAPVETLKSGDRIALYITRIKVTGSFGNFRDEAGEKVLASPGRPGGWRVVTIESVAPTTAGLTVKIKEKLNLEKIKSVSELTFQDKNGYVTDVTGN
jgi:hypothetical protein